MNIYVGNLDLGITQEDLKKAFETFGEVEIVKVIKDANTGKSRGFGFVEVSDEANAKSAIDALDGTEMQGNALKVNKARPRNENRGGRGGYGGGRRGGRQGGGRRF